MFLKGLRDVGVPITFSTWHTNVGSLRGSTINFPVQERSRSVKSIFAVQKRGTSDFFVDNGASFFDTSANGGSLQNFQFRVGARYFPAQACQTSAIGGSVSNGGSEAFVELSKALNTVGDYRLQTNTNPKTWAVQPYNVTGNTPPVKLPEFDYSLAAETRLENGQLKCKQIESTYSGFCGTLPSSNFVMASSFETSNGVEISGLNAEEQSDISLMASWSSTQQTGTEDKAINLEVYTYYDVMLVLRPNNIIELIY